MRHDPTPAEDCLWQALRNRQLLGRKFRRQHAIDRFIVDFYDAEDRLIIEVDGPIHQFTPQQDASRQSFLKSQGYRILRLANDDILNHLPQTLSAIREAILATSPERGAFEKT